MSSTIPASAKRPASFALKLLLLLCPLFLSQTMHAQTTFTIITGTNGPWNTTANWSSGTAASGAGNIATIGTGIGLSGSIALNVNETLGQLTNTGTTNFTITATGGTFTFDNTGGANNVFGNGDAAISTSGTGSLTVNPNILFQNTNFDVGSTSTGAITLGTSAASTITAGTSATLNFRANSTGAITVNSSIGTSGSSIAIANLGTGTNTVTLSGTLGTDVSSVMQNSAGSTLVLGGANTFTGGVNLTSGTLQLTNATAAGSGTIAISNGAILYNQTAGGYIGNYANALSLSGSVNIFVGTKAPGYAGTILLGSPTVVVNVGGNSVTTHAVVFIGVISDGGNGYGLTETGGTLYLAGANTYTGLTTINSGGTLILGGTDNGGTSQVGATGSLVGSGTILDNGLLNFGRTNSISQGTDFGVINGTGAVTLSGGGTVTLSGSNGYSGATTVSSGALILSGTLNGSNISNSATFTETSTGAINGSGVTFTNAAGTSTLGGSNNYTGATTITTGTLQLNNALAVQNSTVTVSSSNGLAFSNAASGTSNYLLGGLAGTGTFALADIAPNPVTISVGNNNASTVFSGGMTGSGTLNVVGGSLTLSGSSSYSGGTTLTSGSLIINNASALGTSTFAINGGTVDSTGTTTLSTNNPVSIGGNFGFGGSSNLTFGHGAITNGGNYTVTLSNTNALTLGGTMTNTSNAAQTLTVSGTSAVSSFVFGGYSLSGTSTTSVTDIINGTGNVTINGLVSSGSSASSGLTYSGSSTLTLNGANTFSGGLNVLSGNVAIGLTGAVTSFGAGTITLGGTSGSSNATLNNLDAGGTTTNNITVQAGTSGTLTIESAEENVTYSGSIALNNNVTLEEGRSAARSTTFSGVISGSSTITTFGNSNTGGYGVFITGSNATSFTGNVLISQGLLGFNFNSLGQSSTAGTITFSTNNGGIGLGLQWSGSNTQDLSGRLQPLTGAASVLLDFGSNNVVFSSTNGLAGLTTNTYTKKDTVGVLALAAPNSFAGTYVTGGTNGGTTLLENTNALQNATVSNATGGITFDSSVSSHAFTLGNLTGAGSIALVDNSGTNAVALTVGGNNGSPAAYTGVLSGSGSLTKTGTGLLILSGSDTYSGGTTISGGGTLRLGNASALGATTANLTINSGTLDMFGNSLAVGLLTGSSGAAITSSSAASITLTENSAGNGTYAGSILNGSGTIALTQAGSGTLVLSGSSNYSGGTTISAGAIKLGNASALGAATGNLTINSGTLDMSGNSVSAGLLTGNSAAVITSSSSASMTLSSSSASSGIYAGTIQDSTGAGSGTIALIKAGTGSLTLSGSNSYGGGTTITGGMLEFAITNAMSASGTVAVGNGATLAVAVDGANQFTLATSGAGSVGGLLSGTGGQGAPVTWASGSVLGIDTTAASGTYAGAIGNPGGNLGFNKLGANTLTLTGSNSYSGGTTITAGALVLGSSNALGVTTGAPLTVNGTLDLGGNSETVGVINGGTSGVITSSSNANITLTTSSGGSGTFAGAIVNGSGTTAFTQAGTGTQTLSGSNTYTGATTVTQGTLKLDFSQAGAPASNIISSSSALFLGGSGTLAGGTLLVTGSTGALRSQTFNGATIGQGADAITITGSTTVVTLGAITRNVGGTVNFTEPSGTISGSNGFITSTGNTSGIIGGWAVVGGTDWASVTSGSNIVGLSANGGYTNDTWASGSNVTVTGTSTQTANSTVNSLRFNSSTPATVNLSGSNFITSGGILVTAAATGANVITGGTLSGASGADLVVYNNQALTIASVIANNGGSATGLTKAGSNTLTLSASNTYTGATIVNGGSITISSGSSTTSGWIFNGGGTLTVAAGASMGTGTFAVGNAGLVLNVFATGQSAAIAPGAIQLNGNLSYSNGFATGGNFNLGTGAVTLGNNVTFSSSVTNSNGVFTIGGNIGDGGNGYSVTINGGGNTGRLALNGSNSYSGGTVINNGAIFLPGSNFAIGTGTFTINGGTIGGGGHSFSNAVTLAGNLTLLNLGGSLTLTGPVTLTGNRSISMGDSITISGTIGDNGNNFSLTFNGQSFGAASQVETLNAANTFGGGVTIGPTGTATNSATFNFGNLGSGSTASAIGTGTFTINGGTGVLKIDNTSGASGTLATNNAEKWNGDFTFVGTKSLDLGTGAVTLGATRNVTVSANTLTVDGIITDSGSSYGITKLGSGTLALTGSNTFSGTTTISAGTLSTNNLTIGGTASGIGQSSSAAGNLVINGGVFQYTGLGASTDRLFTIGTSGGTLDASGSGAVLFTNTGTIAFSSTSAPASLTLQGSNTGTNTLAAAIVNAGTGANTTSLTKTGAGTWVLTSASNSYSGATTITSGTLLLGNANAVQNSTVTVNSVNGLAFSNALSGTNVYNVGDLATGGVNLTLSDTNNAAVYLNIGGNNATTTISGTLSGSGGLIKNGTGGLTLSSTTVPTNYAHTYSGGTTLNAGTLTIGGTSVVSGGNIVSGPVGTGTFTLNGGTLAVRGNPATLANAVVTSGTIHVNGSGASYALIFDQTGVTSPGGFVLAGDTSLINDSIAGLTINPNITGAHNLTLTGSAGSATPITVNGNVSNGGTLTLNNFGSGAISLSGSVTNNVGLITINSTAGTTTLSGTVSSNSAININASGGTVSLTGSTNNTGSITSSILGGGIVKISGALGGNVQGLFQNSQGYMILSESGTFFAGGVTLNAGEIQLNTASGLGSGTFTINGAYGNTQIDNSSGAALTLSSPGAEVWNGDVTFIGTKALNTGAANPITLGGNRLVTIYNTSNALTVSGSVGDGGHGYGIAKTGIGSTLALTGTNTYSGATTVYQGYLQATDGVSLPTNSNLVLNGGVLQTSGTFTRPLGIGSGSFQFGINGGGFGANGASLTVAIGGTSSPTALSWGSSNFLPSGSPLIFADVSTTNSTTFLNALNLSGSAQTVTVTTGTDKISGVISDSGGGTGSFVKNGSGTLMLSATETYTGPTIIKGGTVLLTGSLNSSSSLTFDGGSSSGGNSIGGNGVGTFTGSAGNQSLATLTFSSGEGNVSNAFISGTDTLSFTSLASRTPGATGNFIVTGGSNGLTNKIVINGQATGLIDPGIFFGGSNYAYYDSGGFVRAYNYSSDPGAAIVSGSQSTLGSSGTNVQYTSGTSGANPTYSGTYSAGATTISVSSTNGLSVGQVVTSAATAIPVGTYITSINSGTTISLSQGLYFGAGVGSGTFVSAAASFYNLVSAQTTGTYNTIDLTGTTAGSVYIAASGTVTTNGILRANGTSTTLPYLIGGGAGSAIETGSNAEMVIRTDTANDALWITTAIVANGNNDLVKSGAGTLTLTASNSYTGTTYVNAGNLVLGGGNVLSGSNVMVNGGTVTEGSVNAIKTTANVTLNSGAFNAVSATGTLANFTQYGGSTSINASGAPALITVTGTTTLNGGSWSVGTSDNAQSGWTTFAMKITGGNNAIGYDSNNGGGDRLTVQGGGLEIDQIASGPFTALTLESPSAGTSLTSVTAALNLSGGLTYVPNAANPNATTIAYFIANPANSSVPFKLSGTQTFNIGGHAGSTTPDLIIQPSIINGTQTGGIIKTGSGVLALTGNNSYTGSTTINQGAFLVTGNSSGATGAVAVNGGGTLGGTGIVGGAVTLAGGVGAANQGNINLQDGAIGTLTLKNGLTIGSGGNNSNLMFDLAGTSLTSDMLAISGGITMLGTGVISVDDLSATALQTGAYVLITGASGLGTNFTLSGTTITVSGTTYNLSLAASSGTAEILTVSSTGSPAAPGVAYWQGALSGTWATVTSGSTNFVTSASGTANTGVIPGAATNVLFTANSGTNLNTMLGQDFTINSLEFTGSSTTAGSSSVTIGGTNTLTIIAGGTNGNTAGNGIMVDAGSAAHTISSNVALGSSQTWTVNGSPLTVSGTVSSGSNAYGLTKSGTGTLILSASDSYTGPTAVNSGILQVDGSLSGSSAVTVNAATLQGIGTVSGSVALTGSSTLASSGTLTLAQGFSVSGSSNTLSNGTVSGNATQAAGSQFAVNGTLNGTDNMLSGASLSGNGSVGATTLNGNNTLSSGGTLTVASLGVNGTGNQISSGTVNATGGTTLASNSGLAVNGTLGGSVTTGSGSVLSGTGTLTGALTVSAGARTYPGSGTSAAVLTMDLTYNSGAVAEFGVFSGTTPHGGNAGAGTAYDQIVVTGSSSPQLQIGAGTAAAQISSGTLGSAASGVTLTLSMTTAVFNDLKAGASGSYQGVASNNTLNNYFVFSLGSGTLDGRFQSLDLIINGTDEGAQTIQYGGTGYGRFGSSPGATNTLGDVTVDGQEFALSYTGNYLTNSTIGGNDIVLTAIPEPSTWGMILSGFGMLVGIQKLRKRRVG